MNKYMKEALAEAKKALDKGEVPVGAVVVKDGEIVGRGHNLTESHKDPTYHAEIIAIRMASEILGTKVLDNCTMYVTLEPCSMCAGALVLSKIKKLCIGAMDPKAGACGSVFDLVDTPKLNHRLKVETSIMEEECSKILKDFFRELRV